MITPRFRFRLWIVAILAILIGMPAWLAFHDNAIVSTVGWLLFTLILVGIGCLLATTPRDAIRLPVRRSQWIILIGVAWLHANAMVWVDPVNGVRLMIAAAMLLITWMAMRVLVRREQSPWWAVLAMWHPATIVWRFLGSDCRLRCRDS